MNKKKLIIAIIVLLMIIVFSFLIFNKSSSKKREFKNHSKYALTLTVTTTKENKSEKYTINYKYDGTNAKVTSNHLDYPVFITNQTLTFIDEETKYTYPVKTSYKEFDDIILDIKEADKIEERSGITRYSKVLTEEELNRILASLYIKTKVKKRAMSQFSIKDSKLESFNLTLDDTEDFDLLSIMTKFEELEESYIVDLTSLSLNDHGIIRFYESKSSEVNVLEIK